MENGNTGDIRNADIARLRAVMFGIQDAAVLEVAGEKVRDRMYAVTRVFSGLPGSGGSTAHGLDDIHSRLDAIGKRYARQMRECIRQLEEAEEVLNRIPDERLQTFVVLLYIADAAPKQVREVLALSEWKFRRWREMIESAENMEQVDWKALPS